MTVFYPRFLRHDHATGLKAHATHYCPGCGHGLVHKYVAAAIEGLGVQDRTIAVSPVGCAVFLHYYLDVGNTQAAHGRAPAVALGHKLANPDAVVVSYQGDGDLASIGLAEIVHAAQMGVPITVVFVNNAIYGMTGGQLAPTTLTGQRTATSPQGRDRAMGAPLRMSEMIAGIDGAVYVERVALFDTKQRVKAERAIRRAVEAQVTGRGFSFVEVLAECPLHLGLSPDEAQAWVKEKMLPVFPLGVKKDVAAPPWPFRAAPSFDPARMASVWGATAEAVPRFARGFPQTRFGVDIGIKLAGAGGDGAQTAGLLLARAAVNEGFDATHIPSYGPESRGGTSYADVRIAAEEVRAPSVPAPHALVAFNAPSLARFAPTVVPDGVVVYDSALVTDVPALDRTRTFAVPCSRIAHDLACPAVKNVVALGALHAATRMFPDETWRTVLAQAMARKPSMLAVNQQAFDAGVRAADVAKEVVA
jgi:2-oxoisovalerate ferredoxin oxidoreductase beta subunit